MPAPLRTPRDRWIEAGLEALAAGGPDTVRVEPLAQTLGVSRGGFYWQFSDRQALLTAMLDTWEQRSTQDVIDRVEHEGGDARSKARRAGALTFAGPLLPLDLAVRDWARHDQAVAKRLRRVDNRRIDYLRSVLSSLYPDPADVEARSMLAFSLAIGNHYIAANHGPYRRANVLDTAMKLLLA